MFRYTIAALIAISSIGTTTAYAAEKSLMQILKEKRATEVRVSVRYNFNYPLADSSPETLLAMQEKGRRAFYTIAGKECGILLDTIARECRLGNVSVANRPLNARNSSPKVNISGSAVFHLQLKANNK